jgi:hypothetical protein
VGLALGRVLKNFLCHLRKSFFIKLFRKKNKEAQKKTNKFFFKAAPPSDY